MAETQPKKQVHVEDVLSLAGETGLWQILIFIWMAFFFLTAGANVISIAFTGMTPDFLCADGHAKNATYTSLNETSAEQCLAADGQQCRRWVFDPAAAGPSLVTEWGLVCHRRPLLATAQSMLMLGGLFGSLSAGALGGRLGRRTVYLIMLAVYASGTFLSAAPVAYEFFLMARFTMGFGVMGTANIACVLMMELAGPRWRAWGVQLAMLPLQLGEILLALMAYHFRIWWQLQLVAAAPGLSFIFSFWLVPESPRWLILRRRDDEAMQVLATAARVNRRQLPERTQLQKMLEDARNCEIAAGGVTAGEGVFTEATQLWRSPLLRRWMLSTCFCWMTFCSSNYGLSFDLMQLSESPYVAGILAGLAGVPAYLLSPLLDRFGRRPVTFVTAFGSGICMLLVLVNDDATLWLAVRLIAKLLITCALAL